MHAKKSIYNISPPPQKKKKKKKIPQGLHSEDHPETSIWITFTVAMEATAIYHT